MPLSQATLQAKLETELGNTLDIQDAAQLTKVCSAIAKAVVDEIQANAQVNPTLLIAPPTGGPVTGTGTVS